MNEFDIKKFKQQISNYHIKKTSTDILNAYNNQKDDKKITFFNKFFIKKALVPTLCLISCGLLIAFVLPNLLIDKETQIEYVEANSKQNQTAFSIYSGMRFISKFDDNISNISNLKRLNKFDENKGNSRFNEVVDVFDPCVNIIQSLLDSSINVESTLQEGEFVGNYDTYPYSLEVYDYLLYTNIVLSEDSKFESETIYKGEIYIDKGLSYLVELEIESELDDQKNDDFDDRDDHKHRKNDFHKGEKKYDLEVEITIHYYSYKYLQIEQEVEDDKRTYSYSMYDNNKLTYQENISFDNRRKKNDSCFVQILKDEIAYKFDNIKKINNGLECQYRLSKDRDYNSLKMKYDDGNRIYTNQFNDKIIKK